MVFGRGFKRVGWLFLLILICVTAFEIFAVMRANSKTAAIKQKLSQQNFPLSLKDLSYDQKVILLKIEDPAFYEHEGLDFKSLGQGMTTLSQALVKRLYFEKFKSGFAKIEQSLIARFVLHKHFSKDEQLRLFLNLGYFGTLEGEEIIGFSQAAKVYYDKPFQSLERKEFIGLVGMLIGPDGVNPKKKPKNFQERFKRVNRLLSGGCKPNGVFDVWYEDCV